MSQIYAQHEDDTITGSNNADAFIEALHHPKAYFGDYALCTRTNSVKIIITVIDFLLLFASLLYNSYECFFTCAMEIEILNNKL